MLIDYNPKISLGIDYSYEEIGFCISTQSIEGNRIQEKLLHVSCINFLEIEKKIQERDKLKKRPKLTKDQKREMIIYWIKEIIKQYHPTCIIVEEIRLFSRRFISLPAIISFAQLILTIRNTAKPIPVFEVDTRVWKKRMLGSAKAKDKKNPKAEVLEWVKQYITIELLETRNLKPLTHNEADASALSMFARHEEAPEFLKEEE